MGLFERQGFFVESVVPIDDMPIMYKFEFFRYSNPKVFDENKARAEGYHLSFIGQLLQNFLMAFFPNQFCNINVIIARKP